MTQLTIKRAFTGLAVLAAFATPASAQEYVRNGTFDQLLFLSWRSSGQGLNPTRLVFDTTGTGNPNLAFSVLPDSGQRRYWIEQDLTVAAGQELLFSADIATDHPSWGYYDNYYDLEVTEGASTTLIQSNVRPFAIRGVGVYRQRLSGLYVPQSTSVTVRILFGGNTPGLGVTPICHVDNVSCVPVVRPHLAFRGERKLGATNTLDIDGVPGPYAVYVGAAVAAAPFSLPGALGAWALEPRLMLLFGGGGLGASASVQLSLRMPAVPSASGVPLWWQGVQVDTSSPAPTLHLGTHSMQAFF